MNLQLSPLQSDLPERARQVLLPLAGTVASREAMLMEAFRDTPLKHSFELEGSPDIFLTRCVSKLIDYGFLVTGEHALTRLFSTIRRYYGENLHPEIDALIALANTLPQPAQTPANSTLEPKTSPNSQRKLELAYLKELEIENLRELYTAMSSSSEQQYRHYGDRMKVELLPLGKDGSLQPKKRDFPDAVEAMLLVNRAALLGEPGGGKTTAIWRLAMEMAETARRDSQAPIPLLAPLRNWTLPDQSLPEFIASQLKGLGAYLDALLSEKRAALLLDGLNELPVDQRQSKYGQLCGFIKHHPDLLAIVSCRKEDYPPELGFDCINISPLDPIRIRRFAGNYLQQPELADDLFWKLAGPAAREKHKQFLGKFGDKLPDAEQVFWLERQLPNGVRWGRGEDNSSHWESWIRLRDEPSSLMALASNPFMLNMLVGTFKAGGDLPQNRGELFRNFVQIRLDRELKGERILAAEMAPLTEAMARLAFEMQSRRSESDDQDSGGALTVLPREEVVAILGANAPRLLYLASSAGILNIDNPVRFTHQLLQEYFAAQHMDIRFRAGDWKAAEIWRPPEWWKRTNWEVAAVLFTGLYSNDCTKAVEWIAEANPEVAAQCITRSGVGHSLSDAARAILQRKWIERLTDLKSEPNPLARAAIGRALGLTEWDDRKGVGVIRNESGVLLPDIDWVEIPGGEFQYGLEKGEWAAKPQKLTLPTFYIARYPVTYAQFQTFLDDPEGYTNPQWFEGLAADDDARQMQEQSFKFSNHPRETVNWYQAIAFCRWLSQRLGGGYDLKKVNEWAVRLPTEFEWEKAARGTDGRLYPYAGEYDTAKGNTEGNIGQTTAVGIYPNGASPYGVMDMSGNVWEWSLSNYDKPALDARKENLKNDKTRVLRGGSWDDDRVGARAVYRSFDVPDFRDNDIGFRVVVVARPPS